MLVSAMNNTYLNFFETFIRSFIYKLNRISSKTIFYSKPQTILNYDQLIR